MNHDTLAGLTLATLPKHFRQIALWVVITLTVGYTTGLVFTYHTTSMTPTGVQERYRGNQKQQGDTRSVVDGGVGEAGGEQEEMKFEKSVAEMLNIMHTHVLSMASFFAIGATIFAFSTTLPGRWKSILIVEPFVAILTSFASMWLMWNVHPAFAYLLMISSASMALCFYAMMGISFRELVQGERGMAGSR